MNYEPVIGLEVHAQLLTESKIFCGCSTRFGASPNENTCPVCLGLPGALPVLNGKAVELALRAAIAVHCTVPPVSIFARKNYFYPDLPKGYQISQFEQPLAINGHLDIESKDGRKQIRIKRIHMEEDAGKLLHEGVELERDASFVDLNRSGVPLIEIVSEPDMHASEEAYAYLTGLKAILRYTNVSLANMEEGNLRCDANISLRRAGDSILGTKVEIKNLNSFKNVQKAVDYEIERQTLALDQREKIVQETRLFNANKGITESMRSKEEAHDYRYFPEPDLLPLEIKLEFYERVKASIPELPHQKRERFVYEYALTPYEAEILTDEVVRANRYEEAARLSNNPKQTANWMLRAPDASLPPEHIAGLINLVEKGIISGEQAKAVFAEMLEGGRPPEVIVREKGLLQISGADEVMRFVDDVFAANPDVVERCRKGETKLHGVLVGLVMKASGGKANPSIVNKLIKEKL